MNWRVDVDQTESLERAHRALHLRRRAPCRRSHCWITRTPKARETARDSIHHRKRRLSLRKTEWVRHSQGGVHHRGPQELRSGPGAPYSLNHSLTSSLDSLSSGRTARIDIPNRPTALWFPYETETVCLLVWPCSRPGAWRFLVAHGARRRGHVALLRSTARRHQSQIRFHAH